MFIIQITIEYIKLPPSPVLSASNKDITFLIGDISNSIGKFTWQRVIIAR